MEYRAVSAVCCGSYHRNKNELCQDVADCKKWNSCAAIVLADGAGGCNHAREGAETVVQTVLEFMTTEEQRWMDENQDIRSELVQRCLQKLSESEWPVKEQACTLLFCVADATGHYVCGHIGDGYGMLVQQETSQLLLEAENGETLNETVFVTVNHAEEQLKICRGVLQPGEAILICSDGAGESLYQRKQKICAPAVAKICSWMEDNEEKDVEMALYTALDEVLRGHTRDDMSVAILYRKN